MTRISTHFVLTGVFLLLFSVSTPTIAAFQAFHPGTTKRRLSQNTFVKASSDSNKDDDVPSNEGQELAGQFYEQLKKREKENGDSETRISRLSKRQDNTQQEEDFDIDSNAPFPVRKFTGSSPSLFSEQTSSSPNFEREREREFNLVGNFERTLGIQAAILFASIVFVATVGLTGGISDGSDRYFGGADELDDSAIEYTRTDDAAEVLLRQSTQQQQESQWL